MSATTVTPLRRAALAPLPVAALGLLSAFPPFAADMYLPGLPAIARDLRTTPAGVQLTITALLLGMAAGLFVTGALSDRYGRRATLVPCLALCAASGAACALAPDLGTLIGARFVQGITGAACLVIARAVVSDAAEGREAARVFGLMMTVLGVAPVVAPLVGGIVAATAGWRAVFWALAALTLLMLAAALVAVPETPPGRRRPVREPGASVRGLLLDRPFLAYALAFALAFGALTAYLAASPFVLRTLFGLSTEAFSLVLAVYALALALVATANAHLVYRHTPHRLLEAGLTVLLAASAILCGLALTGALTLVACLLSLLAAAASLGLVLGNACALALGRAPRAAGTAAVFLAAAQFTAGAITAPLAGIGGDRAATAMALVMTVCALVALFVVATMRTTLDVTRRERLDTGRIGIGSCDQPR
ncbi:MFS transporter [Sphaerisporangium album]|uniref:MFS transporter n=1 Tax=Sphaerisporangium album TaxID=509200 RepID=A0A367ERH4_9ACTN|nr:Bcr/CflA family efflux MFS transporter [Sphaerisporangium album]RCG20195.1 MFS transporter [Sphaerisporangium album]